MKMDAFKEKYDILKYFNIITNETLSECKYLGLEGCIYFF